MKINKYLAVIALMAFFVSCEQDDDAAVAEQTSNIQIVVEPFGTILPIADFVGQAGTSTIEMALGFRLSEFSTTYFGSDVNVIYDGSTYTIPAGDTEVLIGSSIFVDVEVAPQSAIPYNGFQGAIPISVDLDGFDFEIDVDNRPSDLVVLKGEAGSATGSINATLYNQLPSVPADGINFLFDWNPNDDAGNDLDLRLRMMPGDVAIDYSGSVTNFEDTAITDGMSDGMYQVKADAWSTIGGSIDGVLFAMHADGTLEVFETDLTGITDGGVAEEVVLVNIDKLGSDYTLYQ